MTGLPAFVRWQAEGDKHWRAGDYAWMAERVAARRVLEIGCGAGFGTLALAQRGISTLVVEPLSDCIAIAGARVRDAAGQDAAPANFIQAAVGELDGSARERIREFSPEWIVCWLMGAEETEFDQDLPIAQAVQQHREAVHRQVAELAADLPSVAAVHLVDRTAFPWKIKDTARETMVLYHQATTFAGLPFSVGRPDTLYRKLDPLQWPAPSGRASAGIVPVLGSVIARRTTP